MKIFSADETGFKLFYDGTKRTLFTQAPNLGFFASLDLNHIFRLVDKLGEEIPVEEPWRAPNAEKWDKITFEQFVVQNTLTESARLYMRIFVATMVTNEHYQTSLLWFLWFVKQCGGTKALFAGGGPEWKLVGHREYFLSDNACMHAF